MEEFMANQSQEPMQDNIQQQEQIQEPASEPQEQYFEVKYNKEPVKVPYEQAPEYIQKGLNYEKVQQRATEYEQHLNRLAQLSGYQTHDELIQAIEEAEQQRQMEEYQQAGIDPNMLNKFLENHPDIQFARELKAKQEEEAKFNSEMESFFEAHPEVQPKDIPAEVWAIREREGLPLIHAYRSYMYDNVARQSEQTAIQKLQQNQMASPGPLSGGDVPHNTSIKQMGKSDFNSLVERVLRGEVKNL
ncbi:hypothetical protein [Fictibacillus gelatini]|uniref:hypothetical protein n=1 Tax=Fictibacillus gelatini TaxID=225985 RepID=UPI000416718E|nr:hypothetical protein [Fictibacillus gelatini]